MINIPFITLQYARLQVSVDDREDFDDQLMAMVWLASRIIAKHMKITDIPDGTGNHETWYTDIKPDIPDDFILPQQLDTSSPPVLMYVVPPGTVQQATAYLAAKMFKDREDSNIEDIVTLLWGDRDPTVA